MAGICCKSVLGVERGIQWLWRLKNFFKTVKFLSVQFVSLRFTYFQFFIRLNPMKTSLFGGVLVIHQIDLLAETVKGAGVDSIVASV